MALIKLRCDKLNPIYLGYSSHGYVGVMNDLILTYMIVMHVCIYGLYIMCVCEREGHHGNSRLITA